jgi:hypothetical protein
MWWYDVYLHPCFLNTSNSLHRQQSILSTLPNCQYNCLYFLLVIWLHMCRKLSAINCMRSWKQWPSDQVCWDIDFELFLNNLKQNWKVCLIYAAYASVETRYDKWLMFSSLEAMAAAHQLNAAQIKELKVWTVSGLSNIGIVYTYIVLIFRGFFRSCGKLLWGGST